MISSVWKLAVKKQISIITLCLTTQVWAEEKLNQLDAIYVTGGKEEIETTPGSAHVLDKQTLEKFEYSDIHQVLGSVPGVYIRAEDGYGLRPNIGMRGAPSERSQKITLMEDGILIAPAPYSAPAAYYFPNVARMESVEVFKGPASIQYGPNTVGGAINMVTTPIPFERRSEINMSYGSQNFRKLHAYSGDSGESFGWLLEGLNYGSDGFKELDNGGNTGFNRNDFSGKFNYISPSDSRYYQHLDLKVGYADEISNETYLGLTDDDFSATPYRRYAASQLDKLDTTHSQVHLIHQLGISDSLSVTTKVYQNNFERSWNKFEEFRRGIAANTLAQVLENPTGISENKYYELLTATRDSNGTELEKFDVTDNSREYVSRGIELSANLDFETGDWLHELQVGARLHHDSVDRNHSLKTYEMVSGKMIHDGIEHAPLLIDMGDTKAAAGYVKDKLYFDEWVFTLGVRGELIRGTYTDKDNSSNNNTRTDLVFIPGAGAFYQLNEHLGLLFGMNKGFSPNAPKANDNVKPEESINTELGLRASFSGLNVEAIGFFNDYSNLVGRCRNADSNCSVGEEFNGGNVHVGGLEGSADYQLSMSEWKLPIELTYTYTESSFQESFTSGFSQWGDVDVGDELPYLPKHQMRLQASLIKGAWALNGAAKYISSMREIAGQDDTGPHTDSYTTIDAVVAYSYSKKLRAQLAIDNLLDEVAIVSRRPYGARPNKPRSLTASIIYKL